MKDAYKVDIYPEKTVLCNVVNKPSCMSQNDFNMPSELRIGEMDDEQRSFKWVSVIKIYSVEQAKQYKKAFDSIIYRMSLDKESEDRKNE